VHYQTVITDTYTQVDYHMPLIRLAGMYLLYAEILNEQGKSSSEVLPYVDKVRDRAGLKGVAESWTDYSKNPAKFATKDGLRQIIHQERRIELAFEGQAGWDLRRWKELQDVMSRPMQGWSIYEESFTTIYRPRTIITRISTYGIIYGLCNADNLIVNSNLVQTPNW
jgi:hypothetical protein